MRRKLAASAFLLLLAVGLCPPAVFAADRVEHPELGFSVEYPDGWQVTVTGSGLMGQWLAGENLTASVIVVIEELPVSASVDDLAIATMAATGAEANNRGLETAFGNIGKTTMDGRPARWFIFSMQEGQVEVVSIVYLTMVTDRLSCLFLCSADSTRFDELRPVFDRITASVRFSSAMTSPPPASARKPIETTQPVAPIIVQPSRQMEEAPVNQVIPALPRVKAAMSFAVEQNGEIIPVEGNEVRLRKESFSFLFTFAAADSVLVNISTDPAAFEQALAGAPLIEIPCFSGYGLIEISHNEKREAIVCDQDFHYWFYSDQTAHRFDKVTVGSGAVICRRTIDRLRIGSMGPVQLVEKFKGDTLYVVIIQAERPTMFGGTHEFMRVCIKLTFTTE